MPRKSKNSVKSYSVDLQNNKSQDKSNIYDDVVTGTLKVLNQGFYEKDGKRIDIPDIEDSELTILCSPKDGQQLLKMDASKYAEKDMCNFSVTNEDSFEAASRFSYPMVMNFANAYYPGGGFLAGAIAQEEALCQKSTLYNSLTSKVASVMYENNNKSVNPLGSSCMLYSPCVSVFRDKEGKLLDKPFTVAVATVAAPNRMGEALFENIDKVNQVMRHRIRVMLRNAMQQGNKNLILGAWGCGVFGNSPYDVAENFRQVLVDEKYGHCFHNVCFAIYGNKEDLNYMAFDETFTEGKEITRDRIGELEQENARLKIQLQRALQRKRELENSLLFYSAQAQYQGVLINKNKKEESNTQKKQGGIKQENRKAYKRNVYKNNRQNVEGNER